MIYATFECAVNTLQLPKYPIIWVSRSERGIDNRSTARWLNQPGAPKAKLTDEDPAPITIAYDELIET